MKRRHFVRPSDGRASQTQARLLRATAEVIRDGGLRALTLEAVAAQAQVSKGGLLYHFPSKQALVRGLIEHMIEAFGERLALELARAVEPAGTTGRWMRAYLRATFADDRLEYELSAALTTAVAEEPALLDVLREAFCGFAQAAGQDGLPAEVAGTIRLAADGLWFSEALQVATLSAGERQALLAHLLQMTEG